ncbi:hypothetical protein [Aquabacterium sp. J223]|uniref:hypothetical protein n=1 Tax=Aquabacterium sp. J223 TaxID=2898431 RepID=UPI0021ADC097|nr:hypothetical protein [Aquabacterium sp. J223]UUX94737.1 hypothetical protein LRS07_15825 [Aquabacterium sp. J223]
MTTLPLPSTLAAAGDRPAAIGRWSPTALWQRWQRRRPPGTDERYLAQAADLAELERRQRALERDGLPARWPT